MNETWGISQSLILMNVKKRDILAEWSQSCTYFAYFHLKYSKLGVNKAPCNTASTARLRQLEDCARFIVDCLCARKRVHPQPVDHLNHVYHIRRLL